MLLNWKSCLTFLINTHPSWFLGMTKDSGKLLTWLDVQSFVANEELWREWCSWSIPLIKLYFPTVKWKHVYWIIIENGFIWSMDCLKNTITVLEFFLVDDLNWNCLYNWWISSLFFTVVYIIIIGLERKRCFRCWGNGNKLQFNSIKFCFNLFSIN